MNKRSYTYTTDWFSRNIDLWEACLSDKMGRRGVRYLEVGSWEGRSAIWVSENILTGSECEVDCVDIWEGPGAYEAELRFDTNIVTLHQRTGISVTKHKLRSRMALPSFRDETFDIVYLDGSHRSFDVISDMCLSWPLLKTGGLLICDDCDLIEGVVGTDNTLASYGVHQKSTHTLEFKGPRTAVKSFSNCFSGEFYEEYFGHQAVLRKVCGLIS